MIEAPCAYVSRHELEETASFGSAPDPAPPSGRHALNPFAPTQPPPGFVPSQPPPGPSRVNRPPVRPEPIAPGVRPESIAPGFAPSQPPPGSSRVNRLPGSSFPPPISSFPRKRESRGGEGPTGRISPPLPAWIPAFAGMTKWGGGEQRIGGGNDKPAGAGTTNPRGGGMTNPSGCLRHGGRLRRGVCAVAVVCAVPPCMVV